MALDADKRTAGGYSHHPEGNGVEWQRDLDMSGFVEDILGVEGYVSGDFSQKLNALNGGLGMPLFFRTGSVSQTWYALAMARSVAQIHQQVLSVALDDAHKKQVALDEQLTPAQNPRLNAEISLRGKIMPSRRLSSLSKISTTSAAGSSRKNIALKARKPQHCSWKRRSSARLMNISSRYISRCSIRPAPAGAPVPTTGRPATCRTSKMSSASSRSLTDTSDSSIRE